MMTTDDYDDWLIMITTTTISAINSHLSGEGVKIYVYYHIHPSECLFSQPSIPVFCSYNCKEIYKHILSKKLHDCLLFVTYSIRIMYQNKKSELRNKST